jgi:hypothetical protein
MAVSRSCRMSVLGTELAPSRSRSFRCPWCRRGRPGSPAGLGIAWGGASGRADPSLRSARGDLRQPVVGGGHREPQQGDRVEPRPGARGARIPRACARRLDRTGFHRLPPHGPRPSQRTHELLSRCGPVVHAGPCLAWILSIFPACAASGGPCRRLQAPGCELPRALRRFLVITVRVRRPPADEDGSCSPWTESLGPRAAIGDHSDAQK